MSNDTCLPSRHSQDMSQDSRYGPEKGNVDSRIRTEYFDERVPRRALLGVLDVPRAEKDILEGAWHLSKGSRPWHLLNSSCWSAVSLPRNCQFSRPTTCFLRDRAPTEEKSSSTHTDCTLQSTSSRRILSQKVNQIPHQHPLILLHHPPASHQYASSQHPNSLPLLTASTDSLKDVIHPFLCL